MTEHTAPAVTVANVAVANPDDPLGMPAFDGSLDRAAQELTPGRYPAHVHYMDWTEGEAVLVVTDDAAHVEPEPVTTRQQLDALPIGTVLLDKDGYWLRKVSATEWESGCEATLDGWMSFDTDELLGNYNPGEGSMFLPATLLATGPAESKPRTVLDGLPACGLTCSEAEAIASVLRQADKPELADRLIREHGSGDDDAEDEHHDLYDPEHVCLGKD